MILSAHEVLEDIRDEFGGTATVERLREWFGVSRWAARRRLRELQADGHVRKVGQRYTTKQPSLQDARKLIAAGRSLELAARAIGATPAELDLMLWRSFGASAALESEAA